MVLFRLPLWGLEPERCSSHSWVQTLYQWLCIWQCHCFLATASSELVLRWLHTVYQSINCMVLNRAVGHREAKANYYMHQPWSVSLWHLDLKETFLAEYGLRHMKFQYKLQFKLIVVNCFLYWLLKNLKSDDLEQQFLMWYKFKCLLYNWMSLKVCCRVVLLHGNAVPTRRHFENLS